MLQEVTYQPMVYTFTVNSLKTNNNVFNNLFFKHIMWIDTLMFRHSSNVGIFCRSEMKECLGRYCYGYRLFKLRHYFKFFQWLQSCHMNPKRQKTLFFDQDRNMYQSKWGGLKCKQTQYITVGNEHMEIWEERKAVWETYSCMVVNKNVGSRF